MLPFYLYKRPTGYYKICFVDTETGLVIKQKSAHTKDKDVAMLLANKWLYTGIPEGRIISRNKELKFSSDVKIKPKTEINVNNLSNEEALELLKQLNEKFGLSVANKTEPAKVVVQQKTETSVYENSSDKQFKKTKKHDLAERNLSDFLIEMWTPEKSGYVQSRREHGHGCTERHCLTNRQIINRYVVPYFKDATIGELDDLDFEEFFLFQKKEKGLSASSVNHTINAIKKPFDFAFKKGWITENPLSGVERFSAEAKERGILEEKEVTALFSLQWRDRTAKITNFVAANAGLRVGEVLALRSCDVGDDVIHVMHNWSLQDGLKCPKNGKTRHVPVPKMVCDLLKEEAHKNPLYSETSFIFFSKMKPEQPVVASVFEEALYDELKRIGISDALRKDRNIVFHSWRHYYATLLTNTVKLEQAQIALGHNSSLMTKHYADHELKENLEAVKNVINERFVLQFPNQRVANF